MKKGGKMIIFFILALVMVSFIVAATAVDRKIGFWGAFWISLLVTPVIGIVIVLLSDKKEINPGKIESNEIIRIYNHGIKEYHNGNYEIAVNHLKQANGLQHNNPTILFGLALVYTSIDNYGEAIDYMERAIECGYKDFKKIQTDERLSGLRNTEEFHEFVKNGYKRIRV